MIAYRTIFLFLLMASSFCLPVTSSNAASQKCSPPGIGSYFMEHRAELMALHHKKLHDALNLTPEQEIAWTKLMDSENHMANSNQGKPEDYTQLTTPERAEMMLERMNEHQTHMADHVVAMKDLYAELTPEQRKLFDELHSRMWTEKIAKRTNRASSKMKPSKVQ